MYCFSDSERRFELRWKSQRGIFMRGRGEDSKLLESFEMFHAMVSWLVLAKLSKVLRICLVFESFPRCGPRPQLLTCANTRSYKSELWVET